MSDKRDDIRRATNLGFLAQSTTMSKKRKEIEGVGASTMLDLKAQLVKKQEEVRAHKELGIDVRDVKKARLRTDIGNTSTRNKGVDARIQRDEEARQREHSRVTDTYSHLERKALLYEKAMRGEIDVNEDAVAVDFLQKKYDALRAEGSLQQTPGGGGASTSAAYVPGLMSKDMERERERQEWEAREQAAMEEEALREAQRAERRALIQGVNRETVEGRHKAREEKSEKGAALQGHRERLKEAFLKKQMQKMRPGGAGGGG